MKKILASFIFISMLLSCFAFGACGGKDDPIIRTVRTVGTFSGHRVKVVSFERMDADVSAVVVKYCVDDVYIQTFPDPSYVYLAYTNEDDYLHLPDAYEQGLITHDDLLAIAAAEKPYDTLRDENTTDPTILVK